MSSVVSASANGKIIISGEHAGVYGFPMIAGPISKTVTVSVNNDQANDYEKLFLQLLAIFAKKFNLKLKNLKKLNYQITGDLPRKSGLGSSAAYAGALFRVLANFYSLAITEPELFALVQQSERIFHGNPSGVDAAVIVFNHYLYFQKNAETPHFSILDGQAHVTLKNTPLYAVYSGSATESTKEMVAWVTKLLKNTPQKKVVLESIGRVTEKIHLSLKNGKLSPSLIQENQRLLEELEVMSGSTQKMIKEIEKQGGVAKISGAGGKKTGSGYLLALHPNPVELEDFFRVKKWQFFHVTKKL